MKTFEYSQRVYFSDTDAQGIVYHGAYLDFAEHARSELARTLGTSGLDGDMALVVRSINISYERPAFLDDMLTVYTSVKEHGHVWLTFEQIIKRDDVTVARLLVKVASVNIRTKLPVKLPDSLLSALDGDLR